jgi:hypothetical protein
MACGIACLACEAGVEPAFELVFELVFEPRIERGVFLRTRDREGLVFSMLVAYTTDCRVSVLILRNWMKQPLDLLGQAKLIWEELWWFTTAQQGNCLRPTLAPPCL